MSACISATAAIYLVIGLLTLFVSRRLRGSSRELQQLIALLGLSDVLPSERRRALGQTEQREQPGRVQEGGEADHPAV